MTPLPLLSALALAMLRDREHPTATALVSGVHWRAVWRGGGRFSAVGLPGRVPTVAEAMAAPMVRVDDLPWESRRVIAGAMVRRAWAMAKVRPSAGWVAMAGEA